MKDDWTPTEEEEETKLTELERMLVDLGRKGELEPRAEDVDTLLSAVKAQDALRQRIRRTRGNLIEKTYAFADLVKQLRCAAGASLGTIAEATHVPAEEVERLESGEISPVEIAPETIASFMEVFSIPVSQLARSLRQDAPAKGEAPLPSADGRLAANVESAGSVETFMAPREASAPDERTIGQFLGRVRAVLMRWQREDLLR